MLGEIRARGLPMAVLSNKPHEATVRIVERLLPGGMFAQVQGQRPEVAPKPDPAGALAIARALGVAPEEWLYLGDTDTDMQTARAAGMYPAGALWGFREAEELRAAGARALLDRPAEVPGLLEG